MKKIVFTGGGTAGHVTPNLAIMAKLRDQGWAMEYIGSVSGIEKEMMEHERIAYHPIASGKLRRYFDLKNFKDPFRVVQGTWQAFRVLRRLKPDIVFSKGGFVAVPVIAASRLLRIPVLCHESDMTPGLANKISLPLASRICVTFPETMRYVAEGKAECTGLPIRDSVLQGNASRGRQLCEFHTQKPVLLVMGGSLGAQRINETVRAALPALLQRYQIIHICGRGHVEEARKERGYRQFEFVRDELPDLLAAAELVVSRAGSTSIFELLALRKPMLLIPLSRQASRGDQILNAASFERQGYAKVLQEEELDEETLLDRLTQVEGEAAELRQAMASSPYTSGTARVIQLIEQYRLRRT